MKYRWAPMQLTDHHYGPWSMFLIDHRIAQQHASETVHLSPQFVHATHRADIT